jgi:hypothetical protein
MKACACCDRENDDDAVRCRGYGTIEFDVLDNFHLVPFSN